MSDRLQQLEAAAKAAQAAQGTMPNISMNPQTVLALCAVVRALKLLVEDVQDYEAWQRPCHALEVSRDALRAFEGEKA